MYLHIFSSTLAGIDDAITSFKRQKNIDIYKKNDISKINYLINWACSKNGSIHFRGVCWFEFYLILYIDGSSNRGGKMYIQCLFHHVQTWPMSLVTYLLKLQIASNNSGSVSILCFQEFIFKNTFKKFTFLYYFYYLYTYNITEWAWIKCNTVCNNEYNNVYLPYNLMSMKIHNIF